MAAPGFAKHPNLWFDDGNVVLIAENTGFRVYRGLLARYSEIFRDMFLLPQSEATAAETYESCPVVRMSEDGAEEWERVLGVLHEANGSQQYVTIPDMLVARATDYTIFQPFVDFIVIPCGFPSILWQPHFV